MKGLFVWLLLLVSSLSVFADRLTYSINDTWEFRKENETQWVKVHLPHTWNAFDVADEETGYYRGAAYYQRELNLSEASAGKQVFIYFEGVNQEAELFVNGIPAGKHLGGYTRFCFDITNLVSPDKPNLLEVKVNNSHNDNIPPFSADFTFFGGIYRDVFLVLTDKVHVSLADYGSSGIYIETPEVTVQKAKVKITTLLDNDYSQKAEVIIVSTITDPFGKVVYSDKAQLLLNKEDHKSLYVETIVPNPVLWSTENPMLYALSTVVIDAKSKRKLDETTNPFGFRYFSFNPDKGFSMNGKSVKLIGTNRHQDFRNMGNALPDEYVFRDLRLLKDMGGNFLRISHYPQDPTVLEYCDRHGIISSVEIPIVNRIIETPEFAENCRTMMTEMIKQNFNHPSVLIWAYMNEVLLRSPYSDKDAHYTAYTSSVFQLAKSLENIAKTLDKQRCTMIPNHGDFEKYHAAGLTEIPDIVGWNLYQGWYSGKFTGFDSMLESIHSKLPEKSLIVTEFGPGVDDRIRSEKPERFDFSAEYGQQLNENYLKTIEDKPFVSGAAIWNLNDFYSDTRSEATPHINNKGIVTTNRIPKDGYWFYKASLNPEPSLYIASRGWSKRSGTAIKGAKTCIQPMEVFSNVSEAEFFINGVSLGKKSFENHVAWWDVPFVQGENLLEVHGSLRGKVVKDILKTQFKLIPYSLSDPDFPFDDLNVSLGTNNYFFERNPDIVWLPDQNTEENDWGAEGGTFYRKKVKYGSVPSSDLDILGTENDPIYQTQRVGINGYRAGVPDGTYSVSLYFAELVSPETKEASIYNLGNDAVIESAEERIFNVQINNQEVLTNFNIAKECGIATAVEKKYFVRAENGKGINIHFVPVKGEPVLNGIRIARKY